MNREYQKYVRDHYEVLEVLWSLEENKHASWESYTWNCFNHKRASKEELF